MQRGGVTPLLESLGIMEPVSLSWSPRCYVREVLVSTVVNGPDLAFAKLAKHSKAASSPGPIDMATSWTDFAHRQAHPFT